MCMYFKSHSINIVVIIIRSKTLIKTSGSRQFWLWCSFMKNSLNVQTLQYSWVSLTFYLRQRLLQTNVQALPTWQLSSLLKLKLDQLESWSGKAQWRQKVSLPSFFISLHLPANFLQVCQWRHCYQVLTAYLFCKSDPWLPHGGRGGLTFIMSRHRHHVTRHIIRASVMCGDERGADQVCWRSVHSETSCPEPEPIFIQSVTSQDFSSVEAPLPSISIKRNDLLCAVKFYIIGFQFKYNPLLR